MADAPEPTPMSISNLALFGRQHKSLFPETGSAEGLIAAIMQKEAPRQDSESNQDPGNGMKPHPFDMEAVLDLVYSNEHHSACHYTTRDALVGMGHITEQTLAKRKARANGEPYELEDYEDVQSKVDEALNPLCAMTWQETQNALAEDLVSLANAYIEVVRADEADPKKITGLHHIPAKDVYIVIEDENYNRHYAVRGAEINSSRGSGDRKFACFGDKTDFMERAKKGFSALTQSDIVGSQSFDDPKRTSEIIHIRRPSSLDRWYGVPHWLSAVAAIELVQMLMQYNFDFFLNRGVPEIAAFFLGEQIAKEDWEKIKGAFEAQVGLRNSHKSIAANLPVNPEAFKIQIEKLALDSKDESIFSDMRENLALGIVSAWRVPPLLAGIQIPGKLGATNELPNALMAFQALVIGPQQRLIQQTLGATLGDKDLGVDGLEMKDFEYRKITEEIDVGQMDTVARMRQTPMQAESEGRDLKDGVKE